MQNGSLKFIAHMVWYGEETYWLKQLSSIGYVIRKFEKKDKKTYGVLMEHHQNTEGANAFYPQFNLSFF